MGYTWPPAHDSEIVAPFLNRLSISVIALEAWRRGLRVTLLGERGLRLFIEDGKGRSIRFVNSRPAMTTTKAVRLAGNKHKTNTLLAESGYKTPTSHLVDTTITDSARLIDIAEQIGYPVVLKPLTGSKGTGVFTDIRDSSQLTSYYQHLVHDLKANKVVIESHEDGEMDLRVLVIGPTVVGIIHRVPANITGDGIHTVSELIDTKNKQRAKNPFLRSGPIKKDQEVINYAAAAGHTLETIPEENEYIRLRGKSNGSAGGDSIEVSHLVSETLKQEIIGAVEAFPGLYAAGVDILYTPAIDPEPEQYTIIEINATPQIGLNMYPMAGEGKDAPKAWIDACFPESARSDIAGEETLTFSLKQPIEAVTSGTASEVVLAPIPPARLPHRRVTHYPLDNLPTARIQNKIKKQAWREGISGNLTIEQDEMVLRVAADNEAALDRFVDEVSSSLKMKPALSEPWQGIVRLGFSVRS